MRTSAGLFSSYERTTFRVTGVEPSIDIRVDQPCPALDRLLDRLNVRTWAFITAWNPGSRPVFKATNRRRQRQLEADLRRNGYVLFRAVGIPDDENWKPEESVLAVGLQPRQSIKLGRKFQQLAIVVGTYGEKARLVACRRTLSECRR